MKIPPIKKCDEVPERRIGPGNVGYAFLRINNDRRGGLWVRHRPDGTKRLMFDLTVFFQREAQHDFPHVQFLRSEVTLEDLPEGIDVLIGQRYWNNLREITMLQKGEPWRAVPSSDNTSAWKGRLVSLLDWRIGLRWPVLPDWPGLPPHLEIPPCQMAIWHGDESVCVVDPGWLSSHRRSCLIPAKLCCDDEYTYFFPGIQPC